jgi:hypothetical protein
MKVRRYWASANDNQSHSFLGLLERLLFAKLHTPSLRPILLRSLLSPRCSRELVSRPTLVCASPPLILDQY